METRLRQTRHGFVLQQPRDELPEAGRPVYGKWATPNTVVIPESKKLRQFTRSQIFRESEEKGRKVPEDIVNLWGLKEGDLITFSSPLTDWNIISVNGEREPEVVQNWPSIVGVDKLPSGYPEKPFPVEKFDFPFEDRQGQYEPILRIPTLLAPLGLGHSLWVAGPGGVGKTTIIRALWRASIRMTSDPEFQNLHVMACVTGERDEDLNDLNFDMYNTRPAELDRVELFGATEDEPEFTHVQMADLFIKRAQRLVESGRDVVAFLDSGTKVVMGHSRSPEYAGGEGPWIAGGIAIASIAYGTRLLSVKGQYSDPRNNGDGAHRSLTLICSVLLGTEGEKSSEAFFAWEKMQSLSTAMRVHTIYPIFPK